MLRESDGERPYLNGWERQEVTNDNLTMLGETKRVLYADCWQS